MDKFDLHHIQILKKILSKRQKQYPKYSLRDFAKSLSVSPTTLSQIFHQKKGLSERMAQNLVEKLNLHEADKEVFLLSVRSTHSRSTSVKLASSIELAEIIKSRPLLRKNNSNTNQILKADNRFAKETLEVQKLIENSMIAHVYRYSSNDQDMHFRTLYILKDKKTGEILKDFMQIFFNEKTRQAATVYFLKKENGRFKTYFNNIFDGKHRVTSFVAENQNTEIIFDKDHLPTIPQIRFVFMNTNKHVIGKMQYTLNEFSVTGTLVDFDRPDLPLESDYRLRWPRLL